MMNSVLPSENCVRTAEGYCRIMWQQNSANTPAGTPDSFQLDTQDAAAGAVTGPAIHICGLAFVTIPDASPNGASPLPPGTSPLGFNPTFCGGELGITGQLQPSAFVCKINKWKQGQNDQ